MAALHLMTAMHSISFRHCNVSWQHCSVSLRHCISWRQCSVSWRHCTMSHEGNTLYHIVTAVPQGYTESNGRIYKRLWPALRQYPGICREALNKWHENTSLPNITLPVTASTYTYINQHRNRTCYVPQEQHKKILCKLHARNISWESMFLF
jgi:hypothetical protein